MDGSLVPMKQTKACEIRLKQHLNGITMDLKPTPRIKKNRTKEKHERGGYLKKKTTWLV
jgi:hypothetical protein